MELVKWNKAKRAIIEAKSVDEVKEIKDRAEAMRAYAKQIGESLETQNDLCEIKLRAERKMGGMLKEMPTKPGKRTDLTSTHDGNRLKKEVVKDLEIKHYERYEKIHDLPEERFEEIISETKAEEKELTEALMLKTAKKIEFESKIQKQRDAIKRGEVIGVEGEYEIIVIDPPWQYDDRDKPERGICKYPTMTIKELMDLGLPTANNCVLWLWTTNSFMKEAYQLLDVWGFQSKTILTWHKGNSGMGNYLRNVTEHCILATKGNVIKEGIINNNNQFSTLLFEGKTQHSTKPELFYNMINDICTGRKLDYFARKKREGWDVFGDEIKQEKPNV